MDDGPIRPRSDGRSQSEVVGVILLVAVVVLVVGIIGVIVLSTQEADQTPVATLDASLNATTLTLAHQGGDSLRAGRVTVVLRGATTERYRLDAFTVTQGDPGRFDGGDRWQHAHNLTGDVRVMVIHEGETTSVLLDTLVTSTAAATVNAPASGGRAD